MRAASFARRSASAITIAVCLSLLTATTASAGPSVTIFDSLASLRADQPLPSGGSAQAVISAARNEFESFQLAVAAGGAPLNGLRVDPGPLSGPSGAAIPAADITVYREGTYHVTQPSDREGAAGDWPDVLIPDRDPLYHEDRNGFPVNVPTNGRVVAWLDVFVARDAPPGTYTGSVAVHASSGLVATVPVSLIVRPFTLPSTTTLASAFHIDPWAICSAHTGSASCNGDYEQWWTLVTLYARAALDDRLTISNPFAVGFSEAPSTAAQRDRFERFAVPLIKGTDPHLRLEGARLTSVDAYYHCVNTAGCLATWKDLAYQHGFGDRFFAFVCDEPGDASLRWHECRSTAQAADSAWPGVSKLVTANVDDAKVAGGGDVPSYVDVLNPVVNDIANRPTSTHPGNQAPKYASFLDAARNPTGTAPNSLWLYTSCMSFSCNESEVSWSPSPWSGWPGYAIDAPASEERAMSWVAFAYGAAGELYYNMTAKLGTAFTDQYYSGGNGDGTLFYPGNPISSGGNPGIGGTHPIPLESIRMKRIRDGREDYEYLNLVADEGRREEALSALNGVFGGLDQVAYSTDVSTDTLARARGQLATLIGGGAPPPDPPPPPPDPPPPPPDPPPPPPADPPKTHIEKPRKRTGTTPKAHIVSNVTGATFECRVDRRRWRECPPGKEFAPLSHGRHVVRARAIDDAGRRDPTPAKRRFRVVRHRHP